MRRALVVVAVLVMGAWTCAPPSSGGDDVAGPTTTGLAALIAGEPWHYVGETDEPAFENSWDNVGTQDLAFRFREPGVVDIMGTIGDGSWGAAVFTLPVDYRPSSADYFTSHGDNIAGATVISAIHGIVNSDGTVVISKTTAATVDRVFLRAQVFLTPASTP